MGRTDRARRSAVKEAMRLTGAKTKRHAVDLALREMVARGSVYRALRRLKASCPGTGTSGPGTRARMIVVDTTAWLTRSTARTPRRPTASTRPWPARRPG